MIDYPIPPSGDISPREGDMLTTHRGHIAIDRYNAMNNDADDGDRSRNLTRGRHPGDVEDLFD